MKTLILLIFFFFFHDPATTEIYTLSLHDALPIAGRPALRDVAMPAAAPRFGLYRTPMWGEAEPSTIAALDRARAALERAGAWIGEIIVPPEHQGLTAAQETIMGFELVRGLAHERLMH